MLRFFATFAVAAGLLAAFASAQTQTTTSLADSTPQDNVAGGAVSQRSPGTWVKAALARHMALQAIRLTGPRNGQPNTTEAQAQFGSGTTSSTAATTGGLSGLLSLVSKLGSTGSLGNLTGLLGNLTNGSTTGSTTTTGTSTTGTGTNYTLADLIAMGQAAGATQKSINTSSTIQDSSASGTAVAAAAQTPTAGGAIGRLPKPTAVEQSSTGTTTTQPAATPSFGTRLVTAMTSTFFTAITVGFKSSLFVNALKDALRLLILPPAQQSTNSTNSTSNSNSSSSGIENLPSGSTSGSGSSTL